MAEDAPVYVVDTSRSRFEVWGEDIMSGDHRITFARWRASVRKTKAPEIHAEIAMCSAMIDVSSAVGILRYQFLQCDQFPRSSLDATMKPTGKTNEQLVEGIADLHGVRKKLRFTGFLKEEGAEYRFTAAFLLSRKNFNIRYGPAEPFLKDDVRVIIDVVAVPAAQAPAQPNAPRERAPVPDEDPSIPDEDAPPPLKTWGN